MKQKAHQVTWKSLLFNCLIKPFNCVPKRIQMVVMPSIDLIQFCKVLLCVTKKKRVYFIISYLRVFFSYPGSVEKHLTLT